MKTSTRGFSLIEMIISVAIFAIVMVAVAAAYLNLINLDRQTRATSVLLTNLSFAIDSMARTIRTGSGYVCSVYGSAPDANNTCNRLRFTDENGCLVTYLLQPNPGGVTYHLREDVAPQTGSIGCQTETNLQLTDPRIVINSLSFYVYGTTPAHDTVQPTVLFTINGSTIVDSTHSTAFTIQTSATQRSIDI